jgi:CheR methyltransferase-like protein
VKHRQNRRYQRRVRGKEPGDFVRVWIPACATGEEADSIAMLLLEHADTLEAAPGLQIFGSDLDEGAVQIARSGKFRRRLPPMSAKSGCSVFLPRKPGLSDTAGSARDSAFRDAAVSGPLVSLKPYRHPADFSSLVLPVGRGRYSAGCPLLATFKIFCDRIKPLRRVGALLGRP